jgi:hypothetical protein
MPAKITRLELVIIAAVLVVLLFSNRPPQPGNADTRTDIETPAEYPQDSIPQMQPATQQSQAVPDSQPVVTDNPGVQPSTNAGLANLTPESIPQAQPRAKRYAMVDARNCDSLKYPNVMYGEIAVRWVWDGARFVPRKVCEVRESSGVVSVWSFDEQHEGVVLTEIPADQVPMN